MRRARARNCKMESPAVSSISSFAAASRPAAVVSFGKSASLMNPSRMLRMFTRASEHNMRKISDAALISRLNTPTGSFRFQRHVLGDVHRQRGFAHGRPRRHDDHFAAMQAVRHLVQVREARGHAAQLALAVEKMLNGLHAPR